MSSEEKEKPSPSPPPSPNRPLTWFKPKQSEKQDSSSITSNGDPTTIDVKVSKPVGDDDPKPVSFFGLFRSVFISVLFHLRFLHRPPRFSTRKEVTLNALTLIAAVAAGASQVCFSSFFFLFVLSAIFITSRLMDAFGSLS